MARRVLTLGIVSALAAVVAILPVRAAGAATSDLIPGPPAVSWEVYPDGTGAMTVSDIYGSQAGAVKGFADAYQKSWSQQPAQGLVDRLEHYTSAFWAAFRFGESEGAAKRSKSHSSYTTVPGFGSGAYEVTNPPDDNGYLIDTFVFVQGDYMAVIAMSAKGARPDHSMLMDQATRQVWRIPVPVDEYRSLGSGVMSTVLVIAGVIGAISLVVGAIVLIVVLRSRRQRPAFSPLAAPGPHMSPDRRYWWDGQSWQDAAAKVPPGVYVSPDGRWWDGVAWRSSPPPIS